LLTSVSPPMVPRYNSNLFGVGVSSRVPYGMPNLTRGASNAELPLFWQGDRPQEASIRLAVFVVHYAISKIYKYAALESCAHV